MLGYCWWSKWKFWSVTFVEVIWCHMASSEVTDRFLLINHDWKELVTWVWFHCACTVTTHRQICNITYLGQHLTTGDLDLRSNIALKLLRSACIWFNVPWREEHDGTRMKPLGFIVEKLFVIKTFVQKTAILCFLSLAHKPLMLAQIWWNPGEGIVHELSNAFSIGPPSSNSFWDNGAFPKKYPFSQNLTFDYLWWPQY